MDYNKELNKLKEDLDKAKDLKIRAETRLEELIRSENIIIEEINSLGLTPENLDAEIKKLEDEIKALFEEANNLMPKDI